MEDSNGNDVAATPPADDVGARDDGADDQVVLTRAQVDELFGRLWDNTDDADRKLAKRVLSGEATWLEAGVLDPSEGTGPWIAEWSPGESQAANLARRYR